MSSEPKPQDSPERPTFRGEGWSRSDMQAAWDRGYSVGWTEAAYVSDTEAESARTLRTFAVDQAMKAGLGYSGADELIRSAATIVAYLRDGTAASAAGGKTTPTLLGPYASPAALHEALDRAWQAIRQTDTSSWSTSDDDDEDVLEQLRTLSTDELERVTFAFGIVRALAAAVRADRHAASAAAVEGAAEAERER